MGSLLTFERKTALITGAASGIGRELATQLAQAGASLALVDVDADGLAQVQDSLSDRNSKITAHVVDMADPVAVATLPTNVLSQHDGIDVLVNNAGLTIGGNFLETEQPDVEHLLQVNLVGPMRLTRAFLPQMIERPNANLCFISSIFGIVAVPGQAAYCASKFGIRGFSNSLRYELKRTNVAVTTVHPGGIKTNIAKNAKPRSDMSEAEREGAVRAMERGFITTPQVAAQQVIDAIKKGSPRVIVGKDAQQMAMLERFRPVKAWDMISSQLSKRLKGKRANG